jgi:hypothetical protein
MLPREDSIRRATGRADPLIWDGQPDIWCTHSERETRRRVRAYKVFRENTGGRQYVALPRGTVV